MHGDQTNYNKRVRLLYNIEYECEAVVHVFRVLGKYRTAFCVELHSLDISLIPRQPEVSKLFLRVADVVIKSFFCLYKFFSL